MVHISTVGLVFITCSHIFSSRQTRLESFDTRYNAKQRLFAFLIARQLQTSTEERERDVKHRTFIHPNIRVYQDKSHHGGTYDSRLVGMSARHHLDILIRRSLVAERVSSQQSLEIMRPYKITSRYSHSTSPCSSLISYMHTIAVCSCRGTRTRPVG
jgi:hypothetical protein